MLQCFFPISLGGKSSNPRNLTKLYRLFGFQCLYSYQNVVVCHARIMGFDQSLLVTGWYCFVVFCSRPLLNLGWTKTFCNPWKPKFKNKVGLEGVCAKKTYYNNSHHIIFHHFLFHFFGVGQTQMRFFRDGWMDEWMRIELGVVRTRFRGLRAVHHNTGNVSCFFLFKYTFWYVKF